MTSPYRLTLDLRVLDHLGIKLYSNAAAILSEAVANAWDADATKVSITTGTTSIVVEDNGVGMALDEINDRFLAVGYDKRKEEGEESENGRPFMGRKGIGKLALFSLAGEIEIHTTKSGQKHAFRMVTADIKAAMKSATKEYNPPKIQFAGPKHGTKITLRKLTKKRASASLQALRKRIARRFSVIGHVGAGGDRFDVLINSKPVGPKDRDDLKAVEFLWEFGSARLPTSSLPLLKKRFALPNKVSPHKPSWKVSGWLGAADEPKKLRSDEAGTLNGIVVIARGRLIQENVLDKLNYTRILGSYLTGQIDADFLDVGTEDDIATSDRQRLVEDDERYVALTTFLRKAIVSIQDSWTDLRNTARGKQAVKEHPALSEWIESLPETQQVNAERLIGLIRGVELDDGSDRKQLYRSGMLAFERLRLREQAHLLEAQPGLTAAFLLPLLSDLSVLEGSLYREIVQARLEVIKEFTNLVDSDEKEKVLQKHLFKHLWLLDPGWERAAGSPRIEDRLQKSYKEFNPKLSDAQSKGRVDIRYRTNGGEHIIVELKRASRVMTMAELVEQGNKYRSALRECLVSAGTEDPHISVVFVLGKAIKDESEAGGKQRVRDMLKAIGARAVNYEALITGALDSYAEFLKGSEKADKLDAILRKLK